MSRFSTEAEYRALASSAAELCWLRMLLKDFGVFLFATPVLWCDNVSALAIAYNLDFHACTKHIEVDYHFVRERILRHDLQVQFVASQDQLADILTKGLPSPRFQWLVSKLMWCFPMRLRGDLEQQKHTYAATTDGSSSSTMMQLSLMLDVANTDATNA